MRASRLLAASFLAMLTLLPILLLSNSNLCPLRVSAVDNPCLAQEGTIEALKLENLGLRLTNTALAAQPPVPRVITVPVVITATPLPPTPSPTLTRANSQVQIVQVVGAGNIASEGVEIVNNGPTLDLVGWTISDAQGNAYVFPERRLFTGGMITLYTRTGEDTAIALFWGRGEAVFGESGDMAILRDAEGAVMAVYQLP